MRLLHTTELRFEEFLHDQIPDYAILSHRWGDNEVSYQDFLTGNKKEGQGYAKIMALCKFAAADKTTYRTRRLHRGRFDWVWIDTCCIDKSSSAELSEAINCMYRWYADCIVCYAYLQDVAGTSGPHRTMNAFEVSQWFGRGWTLQELLAPPHVEFLSKDWERIGTRDSLTKNISSAAGISQSLIRIFWQTSPTAVSTAEKFSWVSTRKTSRLEDQAYCLMGLFDINMPLLYGEGTKAFRRLQLEILRSSNDESIFLWDIPVGWPWARAGTSHLGLLATQTTDFGPLLYQRYERRRTIMESRVPGVSRPPYTITNQGLELRVPKILASKPEFFLPLNYRSFDKHFVRGVYAILLRKADNEDDHDGWQRVISEKPPGSLPMLPTVEYEAGPSVGLFIAPESWLWSREQLAEMETEVIYVRL